MLTVSCWKWGRRFDATHVNVLRAGLDRHLELDHELVCVTDDPAGLDGDIRAIPMPTDLADTPRCRRRMQQFSREFGAQLGGGRTLALDLDIVIVGDLTALVNRPEPIVGWKVGYAGVMSGSFLLFDAGALDEAWLWYASDPVGYPRVVQPRGVPSDQAMVNHWLSFQPPIPFWTEADGFVTYFGRGYQHLEHLGVGTGHPVLPAGARVVVLGSDDLAVLADDTPYAWVREHWLALVPDGRAC
jgi:hypothetical protein